MSDLQVNENQLRAKHLHVTQVVEHAMDASALNNERKKIASNARLCAQAPAMLELLIDVLGCLDRAHVVQISKRISAIIDDAEGA